MVVECETDARVRCRSAQEAAARWRRVPKSPSVSISSAARAYTSQSQMVADVDVGTTFQRRARVAVGRDFVFGLLVGNLLEVFQQRGGRGDVGSRFHFAGQIPLARVTGGVIPGDADVVLEGVDVELPLDQAAFVGLARAGVAFEQGAAIVARFDGRVAGDGADPRIRELPHEGVHVEDAVARVDLGR